MRSELPKLREIQHNNTCNRSENIWFPLKGEYMLTHRQEHRLNNGFFDLAETRKFNHNDKLPLPPAACVPLFIGVVLVSMNVLNAWMYVRWSRKLIHSISFHNGKECCNACVISAYHVHCRVEPPGMRCSTSQASLHGLWYAMGRFSAQFGNSWNRGMRRWWQVCNHVYGLTWRLTGYDPLPSRRSGLQRCKKQAWVHEFWIQQVRGYLRDWWEGVAPTKSRLYV